MKKYVKTVGPWGITASEEVFFHDGSLPHIDSGAFDLLKKALLSYPKPFKEKDLLAEFAGNFKSAEGAFKFLQDKLEEAIPQKLKPAQYFFLDDNCLQVSEKPVVEGQTETAKKKRPPKPKKSPQPKKVRDKMAFGPWACDELGKIHFKNVAVNDMAPAISDMVTALLENKDHSMSLEALSDTVHDNAEAVGFIVQHLDMLMYKFKRAGEQFGYQPGVRADKQSIQSLRSAADYIDVQYVEGKPHICLREQPSGSRESVKKFIDYFYEPAA